MGDSARYLKVPLLVALSFMLSACKANPSQFETSALALKRMNSVRAFDAPAIVNTQADKEPPIPEFKPIFGGPPAQTFADARLVSISVSEATPVRDLFIELARKAEVDLELDPNISGGIILTMTDRPLLQVIETVCDLAELRFTFRNNTLQVERDFPYLKQYHFGLPNIARSASSTTSSSTDASTTRAAVGAGGGGGGSNKSAAATTSATRSDLWPTIATNIRGILQGTTPKRLSTSGNQISSSPTVPPTPTVSIGSKSSAPSAPGNIVGIKSGQRGGTALISDTVGSSSFSINAQAGIVVVFGTQRQQKAIARYLHDVVQAVTQQVLIEAKVLEIQLSSQYRAGINWTAVVGATNQKLNIATNFSRNVVPPNFSNPTLAADWNVARGVACPTSTNPLALCSDLTAMLQLVNEFGTVRNLSSPRLTVTNNQVAVLKTAKNQVFFQLTATATDSTPTTRGKTAVTSQIKTVPIGFILMVQPAIDAVGRHISLSLRPSLTRITGFIQDPGVQVTIAQFRRANPNTPVSNLSSPIPIVETREMESIVNMASGETIVMGGLMQDSSTNIREGIPGAMDVPIVGQALSENIKQNSVTELVIFLRATIVSPPDTISEEDQRLYKTFASDPRP